MFLRIQIQERITISTKDVQTPNVIILAKTCIILIPAVHIFYFLDSSIV